MDYRLKDSKDSPSSAGNEEQRNHSVAEGSTHMIPYVRWRGANQQTPNLAISCSVFVVSCFMLPAWLQWISKALALQEGGWHKWVHLCVWVVDWVGCPS